MVLVADDLWKTYGDRSVVQGVSFSLAAGEVLGFLGANGAGKTTTVGMLYGAVVPSRGRVTVEGFNVQTQGRRARQIMGVVTQEDNLDPDFSVFDNLRYFASFYGITGRAAQQRASELLAQVGLEDYPKHRVDQLSGGLKRRLVLARALINQPRLVFLDEPTTGLDPDARQDFWRLVTELKQAGCGVLLTTHYMDEAQRLCDRLLLLQNGQVINSGTPLDLIHRTIGEEVIEVDGFQEDQLQPLLTQFQTWGRPVGVHYLIAVPPQGGDELWEYLSHRHPIGLSRRRANLEDVFLRLTGHTLDEN
ncbi:MAG: ABC transporter ATP-binding protein [Spirulina sp. DLM2.Bin59]|nr:MAG: ABC transporter ATP-binding protein [Spirulina sp. DLM2.Bin59]